MNIGRYKYKGRGGAKQGHITPAETKLKISESKKKANQGKSRMINLNELHGDKFFMAFDEAFRLLYIDLKIIAGACGG